MFGKPVAVSNVLGGTGDLQLGESDRKIKRSIGQEVTGDTERGYRRGGGRKQRHNQTQINRSRD